MEKTQKMSYRLSGKQYKGQVFFVRLYGIEEAAPYGSVLHFEKLKEGTEALKTAPINFQGLDGLLFRLDTMCDLISALPRESRFRYFTKKKRKKWMELVADNIGRSKTNEWIGFSITVLRRDFSSLQGILNIRGERYNFRSGMEMMKILQEMLWDEQEIYF